MHRVFAIGDEDAVFHNDDCKDAKSPKCPVAALADSWVPPLELEADEQLPQLRCYLASNQNWFFRSDPTIIVA